MTAVRLSQVFLVCSYFKKVLSKSKLGLIHDTRNRKFAVPTVWTHIYMAENKFTVEVWIDEN